MAKQKFQLSLKELTEAAPAYLKIWEINSTYFPFIKLDIKDPIGNPRVGLLLNLRNFDFLPPSATLMDVTFKLHLGPGQVPVTIEGTHDDRPHIMFNQHTKRLWFCTPGVQEYHDFYKEDPWEFLRYTEQGKIVSIINNICNLIDRKKWTNQKEAQQ